MGKSIGKSIMGLFVERVEEEKQDTLISAEKPTPVCAETTASGTQDEATAKLLSEALEKANIEGFDYFEFAQMLQALKPSLPSEQTLFLTAYTSGKVMGATKEKLVQTAQTYLGVLNKKAQEFEAACQARTTEAVVGREKELQSMETDIQEKAAAIHKLTEDINTMTAEKTKVSNEIAESKVKIETKRNNFQATLQTFMGKIQSDIEKINRYIQ